MPGVAESTIETHEDAAKIVFASMLATGAAALISFASFWYGRRALGWLRAITLLLTLLTVGLMAWTSNLGGKIRHTELQTGTTETQSKIKKSDHDH